MSFMTVAAFKTVKSWGLMQYVNLSYDIGETSKKVLGQKCFSDPVKKPSKSAS